MIDIRGSFALFLLASVGPALGFETRQREDFHGLLFTCGRHPTVQVSGNVVYAYEADLTRYVAGTARLATNAVTLTFPKRHATFTITRRGRAFFSGRDRCQADDI